MTVKELIAELQKMPPDADVTMWVAPTRSVSNVHWVERRNSDMVCLNDIFWTPYAEEDEHEN